MVTFGGAGLTFTTATTAWALYELARNPLMQLRLREEVLGVPQNISVDELDSLQYLDWFLRETLRLHVGIRLAEREVTGDVVLPLATPIVNSRGESVQHIQWVTR